MKTKQPIVASLIILAASVFVTAAGTYAFFNAKKTISTNKFAAGTLDLDVTSNGNVNQPIEINNVGASGKISGSRTWKIRNTGTLPGKLIFNLQNINNMENGCNAPEIETEPGCEINNVGELGKAISVTASIDGEKIAESTLENGKDFIYDKSLVLEPGGTEANLVISWTENDVGYGNEVQSDSVNFDMIFRLEQQI